MITRGSANKDNSLYDIFFEITRKSAVATVNTGIKTDATGLVKRIRPNSIPEKINDTILDVNNTIRDIKEMTSLNEDFSFKMLAKIKSIGYCVNNK